MENEIDTLAYNVFGFIPVNQILIILVLLFRLGGNPICHEANTPNIIQFCEPEAGGDKTPERLTNSKVSCYVQSCPTDDFFEYVASSPVPCFCAAPLRIGYRLKSPSFSYFTPHVNQFEKYVTRSLNMSSYQLSIDSFFWEEGPRLRMYLKLFPPVNNVNSTMYNATEVQRIRDIFASWQFPPNDFFGPYELLNFTLLGPYAQSMYCCSFFQTKMKFQILS